MKTGLPSLLIVVATIFASPSYSQDNNAAVERARIANERIQIEAERRAEEELSASETQVRSEESPQPAARVAAPAVRADNRPAAAGGNEKGGNGDSGSKDDVSRMLEQIRTLGELHEAGYVTDDEFSRIKRKILDSQL